MAFVWCSYHVCIRNLASYRTSLTLEDFSSFFYVKIMCNIFRAGHHTCWYSYDPNHQHVILQSWTYVSLNPQHRLNHKRQDCPTYTTLSRRFGIGFIFSGLHLCSYVTCQVALRHSLRCFLPEMGKQKLFLNANGQSNLMIYLIWLDTRHSYEVLYTLSRLLLSLLTTRAIWILLLF